MSCQNAVNTKGIQKKNSKETLKPQTPIMGWSSWNGRRGLFLCEYR
jgi:hypothetical protein